MSESFTSTLSHLNSCDNDWHPHKHFQVVFYLFFLMETLQTTKQYHSPHLSGTESQLT